MEILNIGTALVVTQTSVLLINRNNPPYTNWYAFPGGKIETGEQLDVATQREIREETGFEIDNLELYAVVNEHLYDPELSGHFILYYFLAKEKEEFNPHTTKEGELTWHEFTDLPDNIVPSDRKILEKYLDDMNGQSISYFECKLFQQNFQSTVELTLNHWVEK